MLTTVGYDTSPATHITYLYENADFPFALTGITDENGHRVATWTYDDTGRAVSSQLAGGINFTSVTYDDATGNRLVQGPLGIVETYKFTPLQGVPKVTEIDRASNGTVAFASRGFSYDSNGYLATATDWNGNQTAYTNNSHGLPTQIVYASGTPVAQETDITYDGTWAHLPASIVQNGVTASLTYDSSGNLATRTLTDTTATSVPYSTNGQTRTWTFTYTSSGQLTSFRLPRTDVYAKTALGYSGGVLNFTSDALGHTVTVNSFTPGGRWTKVTDQNGVQTQLSYSSRLWLTSAVLMTSAGNLTTSLDYDSAGNLTKTTLPDGSYLSYAWNDARQLTQITNALSETANFTYNSAGNLTQALLKNSGGTTEHQHSATFDALGRMLTDVGGVSQTTTFAYDSNSNVTSITDPLSHVTTRTFDALNRPATSTNAVHDLAQFSYDSHSRFLTVTDGKGNATSFVYDGFGDMIQQVSPDSGTSVFWFDPDGNVTKQSAFAVTNYTYDALDRLLTRTYPADSSLNVALTYDQTGTHGSGIGRLTSLTDQAGSLSLTWDQRGLLTTHARTIGATTYTTGYSYESAGRLASITYPTAGWKVAYVRDAAGQVTSMTDKPPSSGAVNLATSIAHLPFGPVSGFTYGNGVTDTRTFDLDYRMTAVQDVGTSGNIQYLSYGYDADNNPTSITDNVTAADTQTLTYDAIDRLGSASATAYGTFSSITYDSNSNRLTYGATSYTVPSGSDKTSAVGASAITYTSTGNMAAVGSTTSMTYNKANRLASLTLSGATTAYTYGADGYRLTDKTGANPAVVYNYGQDGMLLAETRSTETDYAWLDGFPIATIRPSTSAVNAVMTDNLGTPKKAANASQTLTWALLMNPNGGGSPSPNSITQSLRWPGTHGDAAGYFANGLRTNQPLTVGGRMLEVDPIGLGGGLNPIIYAGANPFKNVDPNGTCFGPLLLPCLEGAAWLYANAPWAFPLATAAVEGTFGFYAEGGGATNPATAGAAATVPAGEMCTAPMVALPAPLSGSIPSWGGAITAGAVPAEGLTAYRVWGGESQQIGSWLSPIMPESSAAARSMLALPEGNSAAWVSKVTLPQGTQIQYGPAASAFGQNGGGTQIQILQRIPTSNFGPGVPLR